MEPNFPRAHMVRDVYVEKREFVNALADIERYSPHNTPWDRVYVLGRSGRPDDAESALEVLKRLNRRQSVDPGAFAWAYVGMGNKDEAFAWLGKAFTQHSSRMVTLKVDPGWDTLRSDPRFQDLLRRVGLAE